MAFGMTVLCTSAVPPPRRTGAPVRFVTLDDLLRDADFVSIHTALTARTRHLIDAAALARMKPGAHLVNTARGGIVDEAALASAVRGAGSRVPPSTSWTSSRCRPAACCAASTASPCIRTWQARRWRRARPPGARPPSSWSTPFPGRPRLFRVNDPSAHRFRVTLQE